MPILLIGTLFQTILPPFSSTLTQYVVGGLAKGDVGRGLWEIAIPQQDRGGFSAQLQRDRGQVFRCGAHDLAADPNERQNLASEPAHAETVAVLEGEIASRHDIGALTARVEESQSRRELFGC